MDHQYDDARQQRKCEYAFGGGRHAMILPFSVGNRQPESSVKDGKSEKTLGSGFGAVLVEGSREIGSDSIHIPRLDLVTLHHVDKLAIPQDADAR